MSVPGDLLEALGREARARLGRGRGEGVRVYRGRTVEELIPQIERDLGADALIVRRREGLTGGVLGFFQHPYIEIEAMPGHPRFEAYDDVQAATPEGPPGPEPGAPAPPGEPVPGAPPAAPLLPPGVPAAPGFPAASAPAPPAPASAPAPPPWAPAAYAQASRAPAPAPAAPFPGAPAQQAPWSAPPAAPSLQAPAVQYGRPLSEPPGSGSYVSPELAALARAEPPPALMPPSPPPQPALVFRPPPAAAPPPPPARPPLSPASPLERAGAFEPAPVPFETPPAFDPPRPPEPERRTVGSGSHERARARVERSLLRYGASQEFARELIDVAVAHTLPLAPRAGLAQAVATTLARCIPVARPLPLQGAAIVLVGPGGAGKTSTCAALLSAYRSGSTLSASYASLVPAPGAETLQMILSPQLLRPTAASSARARSAVRRARREGLAILDTPAVSPSERTRVRELARLLGELEPDRVLVALPATLGARAAEQLLASLAPLQADSMAVTHADETDQLGVALEAACRHGLAPEYLLERARPGGWVLRRVDPSDLAARVLP